MAEVFRSVVRGVCWMALVVALVYLAAMSVSHRAKDGPARPHQSPGACAPAARCDR